MHGEAQTAATELMKYAWRMFELERVVLHMQEYIIQIPNKPRRRVETFIPRLRTTYTAHRYLPLLTHSLASRRTMPSVLHVLGSCLRRLLSLLFAILECPFAPNPLSTEPVFAFPLSARTTPAKVQAERSREELAVDQDCTPAIESPSRSIESIRFASPEASADPENLEDFEDLPPSASSFMPSPSTSDTPALASESLPDSTSSDSVVPASPAVLETAMPYTPTRRRGRTMSQAMLSNHSDPSHTEGVLVGLGLELLYQDKRVPFDGCGFLPRRESDSETEGGGTTWDVPSRIFLDEIYHTFAHSAAPTPPSPVSTCPRGSPSPPFRFAELGFVDETDDEDDDVFRVSERKASGPAAMSTPRRNRRTTAHRAKGTLERGRLEYVKATMSSRAKCVPADVREEGNESGSSSGSSCSASSGSRPEWKH
ncbi:hypothetical protein FA95DRAFT_278903 [Auriscalpium vulgare]|uniref:Uncharacterized protein n=1 Tax=Auriscalpium vulgare TaxID=40419 RepID=A0ACB8S5L9_9AGAM|nr:hypothetical protein FA95DRAFT_278903 [Auriscalpium vulgare]